jgi:arylformamidase
MRIDLEAEYNNRARVPEHPEIIAGWARDVAAHRAAHPANLQTVIPYGPTQRQSMTLFEPAKPLDGASTVLFIHGGYWQALEPASFSHMAKGLNAHGVTTAVAGYDLCPDASVGEIIEQMMKAAELLYKRSSRRVVVCGHSAGGHLAACLVASDWQTIDFTYPTNMVSAGLAISGLFELEPLVPTTVNHKLGLDISAARSFSPRLWTPPQGVTFDAWVGGAESPEYLRQSASIAAVWQAAGNETRYVEVEGANHFTVIAGLAEAENAMTLRLKEMASA